MRRFLSGLVPSCLLLVGAFFAVPSFAGAEKQQTVVLVHEAFADGSGWNKVIPLLQAQGLKVVAVQNPLTSLADDVAAVKRAIENQTGEIILVGHSWGGVVITEAGNSPSVTSLVYVAAFAPSEGQSAFDLFQDYPLSPGLSDVQTDSYGFQTLTPEAMAKDFAQDLPPEETQVMAVTQGPIAGQCFTEKVSAAAWTSKKSWYIIAEQDRMIPPELQKDLAEKLQATTSSLATSHVPMMSKPDEVAKVILEAAGVN